MTQGHDQHLSFTKIFKRYSPRSRHKLSFRMFPPQILRDHHHFSSAISIITTCRACPHNHLSTDSLHLSCRAIEYTIKVAIRGGVLVPTPTMIRASRQCAYQQMKMMQRTIRSRGCNYACGTLRNVIQNDVQVQGWLEEESSDRCL